MSYKRSRDYNKSPRTKSPPIPPSSGYAANSSGYAANSSGYAPRDPRYRDDKPSWAPAPAYEPVYAQGAGQGLLHTPPAQAAPGYSYGIPAPAPAREPVPAPPSAETLKARREIAMVAKWTGEVDEDLRALLNNQRSLSDQITASDALTTELRELRDKLTSAQRRVNLAEGKAAALETQLATTRQEKIRAVDIWVSKNDKMSSELRRAGAELVNTKLKHLKETKDMADEHKKKVAALEAELTEQRAKATKYKKRAIARKKMLEEAEAEAASSGSTGGSSTSSGSTGASTDDEEEAEFDADYEEGSYAPTKRRAFYCSVCGAMGHRCSNKKLCPGWVEGLNAVQRKAIWAEKQAAPVAH